jgi:hypothetical protein
MTGFSLNHVMRENLYSKIKFIVEEMVMIQGGNFVGCENLSDEILVISDRNVITGMDDNSLQLCLFNFIKRINM